MRVRGRGEISRKYYLTLILVFVEYNERRQQHNFAAALTNLQYLPAFHALLLLVVFCTLIIL